MDFLKVVFKVKFCKLCHIANKFKKLNDRRKLILKIISFNGESLCKQFIPLLYLFCDSSSCMLNKTMNKNIKCTKEIYLILSFQRKK